MTAGTSYKLNHNGIEKVAKHFNARYNGSFFFVLKFDAKNSHILQNHRHEKPLCQGNFVKTLENIFP